MAIPADVVRLINEGIRPAANDLASLYYSLRLLQDRLNIPGGAGSVFAALTGKDPIDDGASTDGRPIATPENVKLLLTTISEFLADMEGGEKAKLLGILALSSRYKG